MNIKKSRLFNMVWNRKTFAILFILIGFGTTIAFGTRAVRSYRQFQYVREQGLDRGVASVHAIRPWMTIRYVSVAYSVPEEYIFAQLNIPFEQRNGRWDLGHLNEMYNFGIDQNTNHPTILGMVAQAILDYRANPVPPGLRDIRPWMTIRYIASSTGVPENYLFDHIGIKNEGNNAMMPLKDLVDVTKYPGGPKALDDAIRKSLDQYQENP